MPTRRASEALESRSRTTLGIVSTPSHASRPGSTRANRPRLLAKEGPRQLFSNLPGLALIIVLIAVLEPGSAARPELFALMTAAYGLMLLSSAVLYAVLTFWAFRGIEGEELARAARWSAPQSAREARRLRQFGADEVSIAMWMGFFALLIVGLLVLVPGLREQPYAALGALAAVVASWALIVLGFAVRYLREWAAADAVRFGDTADPPGLGDFVWLAVQMSTAYGFGQASVRTASIRSTALKHNVLAYVFNTVIIALLISVTVSSAT
ncbi:hypothetical protein FM112_04245 [Gulosibacter sp. 10]|nr:hypothetical protein FM112_04245 [Gulosibacter sp. 10]